MAHAYPLWGGFSGAEHTTKHAHHGYILPGEYCFVFLPGLISPFHGVRVLWRNDTVAARVSYSPGGHGRLLEGL